MAPTKKTTQAQAQDVRQVSLPQDMESMLNDSNFVDAKVAEFQAKEAEKIQKRMATRVERYRDMLKDQKGEHRQILARKLLIENLKKERAAALATIKLLREEIRELRGQRKAKRKGQDVTPPKSATA